LFKPGAEKITGMLGMTVHYPSLRDYESAALAKAELQVIVLRCELHDAYGNVVAEGIGARDLRQDWGDLNKAFKMCAKSAHIDATLRLAGISAMFTQDLEDKPPIPAPGFERGDSVDEPPDFPPFVSTAKQMQATPGKQAASNTKVPGPNPNAKAKFETETGTEPPVQAKPAASGSDDDNKLVNRADLANLRKAIVDYGFTEARVLTWLLKSTQGKITSLEQLTKGRYALLFKRLEQWAENEAFRSEPDSQ